MTKYKVQAEAISDLYIIVEAKSEDQAYEMACRLDPSISTATESKRQVVRAINAKDADVVANNPGGQGDVPKLSMAEQIDEQYDKLAGRVG
jgi:hypothetical protein